MRKPHVRTQAAPAARAEESGLTVGATTEGSLPAGIADLPPRCLPLDEVAICRHQEFVVLDRIGDIILQLSGLDAMGAALRRSIPQISGMLSR